MVDNLELFKRFEFTQSMPEDEKLLIIDAAAALGKRRAEEIKTEFSSASPEQILKGQGISIVTESSRDKVGPDFVKFAEFYVKQKRVWLNQEVLEVLGRNMDRELSKNIILCHELYHYFEMSRWGRTGNLFKRNVKLFSVIPIKRNILPAEEIAANSFTKEYLNLVYEPQELEEIYFKNR